MPDGALLPMATSANGVTVVTTDGVVLLTKFVSKVEEFTLAEFEMVPLAGAVTIIVTFVVLFAAKVPSVQFTVPEIKVPPPLAVTKRTFVGNVSLATTLLAVDGPEFVIEIV